MTVANSGRARTLPLKGIIVNSTKYTDLAERSQTSTCPEVFGQNYAPRKNSPDVGGDVAGLTTSPTGGRSRHG